MPEEIAIDQGDGVDNLASVTLSNELLPVGRIPAIARDRHAEFSAEIDGKPLCLIIEHGFTKECADAMPRSATVLHGVSGLQVQGAELLSGHSVSFLKKCIHRCERDRVARGEPLFSRGRSANEAREIGVVQVAQRDPGPSRAPSSSTSAATSPLAPGPSERGRPGPAAARSGRS